MSDDEMERLRRLISELVWEAVEEGISIGTAAEREKWLSEASPWVEDLKSCIVSMDDNSRPGNEGMIEMVEGQFRWVRRTLEVVMAAVNKHHGCQR